MSDTLPITLRSVTSGGGLVLLELSKVEQRYDAVVTIARDGLRVTEVAEKFGVHRGTVYVWLARYEAGGLEGLADRPRRPRSSPLQMAPEVEARVLDARRDIPGAFVAKWVAADPPVS